MIVCRGSERASGSEATTIIVLARCGFAGRIIGSLSDGSEATTIIVLARCGFAPVLHGTLFATKLRHFVGSPKTTHNFANAERPPCCTLMVHALLASTVQRPRSPLSRVLSTAPYRSVFDEGREATIIIGSARGAKRRAMIVVDSLLNNYLVASLLVGRSNRGTTHCVNSDERMAILSKHSLREHGIEERSDFFIVASSLRSSSFAERAVIVLITNSLRDARL